MCGVAVLPVLALLAGFSWLLWPTSAPPEAVLAKLQTHADPSWRVEAQAESTRLVVGREALSLTVRSNRPGHLLVLQAGTDARQLDVVFPNRLDGDTRIEAGETRLPRQSWKLAATGPAGQGLLLLLLVSAQAPDLTSVQAALARRRTPPIVGAYGATSLAWEEINPTLTSVADHFEPTLARVLSFTSHPLNRNLPRDYEK